MFILGVTGPSGAGKGTACEILKEYGFYHIDTDRLVPEVYPQGLSELISAFGPQIFENGVVNKKELAKAAFSSPEATEKLNSILHPLVMNRVSELIEKAKKDGFSGVAVDGAALHEAHAQDICDKILCILAPRSVRLERITRRDSIPESAAEFRFDAQKTDEYYKNNSDAVIENRTVTQLKNDLINLLEVWNHE